MKTIKESTRFFSKGLANYQNKKYELAIKNFTKNYELDSSQIDALYNRALIFYTMGQKDKACDDWAKLKELGQKKGEKHYQEFCNEIISKDASN